MDPSRFDTLVRSLGRAATRRDALAALLAGLVGPLVPDMAGAKRGRGKGGADATAGGGRGDHGKSKRQGNGRGKARGKGRHRKQQDGDATDAVARAGGECRGAGHPCEGNQRCCANLICVVSGPGNASRCTPCGASGERCCADRACAARRVCSADDRCVECGADGQPCCTEGAACTTNDPCLVASCQGGTCTTSPKDCSGENDRCNDGICRQPDGQCVKRPKADGASCGDNRECVGGTCEAACGVAGKRCCTAGAACTSDDPCLAASCQDGVCTAAPKDCSDECNDGVCRQSDGACIKSPKADGTGCNADNGSCQGGVCRPRAGGSCGQFDDPCNRGVRQPDGSCTTEPRNDDELCLAGSNFCTDVGSCRNGSCEKGPAVVCTAADDCHVAGVCDPETGRCSNPEAPNGADCGANRRCQNGRCVEPCLPVQAVCDPATDTCCNSEGAFCSDTAACRDGGEPGRCCRPEGAFCTSGCDCCEGVCAGGKCCQPLRQCESSLNCCDGYNCVDFVCVAACGTDRAFCDGGEGSAPCCEGFRCLENECWPGNCTATTEECSSASECCPDGVITCEPSRPNGRNICCHPYNQTCRDTDECCGVMTCGPQSKCCLGRPFDPDRNTSGIAICSGREHECCPGLRCHPTSKFCCVDEGQPVPQATPQGGGFIECCHFTERGGVCACDGKGETCSAPTGNPFLSTCCDGLICLNGICNSACNPFYLDPRLPCCIGCTHDENTGICDCPRPRP